MKYKLKKEKAEFLGIDENLLFTQEGDVYIAENKTDKYIIGKTYIRIMVGDNAFEPIQEYKI